MDVMYSHLSQYRSACLGGVRIQDRFGNELVEDIARQDSLPKRKFLQFSGHGFEDDSRVGS